ncbi:MAG: hypothetical protein U9R79_17915 [Armatimonadota bacterium]|nr:hypothetical protein [Armatimonadota bacterium]
MDDRLKAFRESGERAVRFQLEYQQPDGSFIWDDEIRDAYHKQPYSWGISGCLPQAHRLLNWIRDNTLQEDGSLHDYTGDVYKQSWFFQGCHRLGRFDLSHPVMGWLMAQQKGCGGLPHFAADETLRALSTAWTGVSALYFGRMDVAERAAEWCIGLLDQPDPGRFYFCSTLDGRLATEEIHENAQYIDLGELKQPYWEIALPWMLMGRLYQATGDRSWLEHANRFFEWYLRCGEDRFTYVGSGKGSLAAAIHYLNTSDTRAREGAIAFGEFLLATQDAGGGWRDEDEPDVPLIYIDHAAEFNVWLQEISGILGSMQ